MTAPLLPEDLDISERLSIIEKMQEAMMDHLRHEQMSRYGYLDHKLLGYRFPIRRGSKGDLFGTTGLTKADRAEYYPDSMIVTIGYTCAEHNKGLCDGNDDDKRYFTTDEIRTIGHADLSFHPSPATVGIRSAKECLCGEAVERQVHCAFNRTALDECFNLQDREKEFSVFLRAAHKRGSPRPDIGIYIREGLRLFALRHPLDCVEEVTLEDSNIFFMRVHETGKKWLAAGEEDRREIASYAAMAHFDFYLGAMRKH
ncbi:hypothetical protein HDU87_003035, partial [Geranomyces variabilis]